MLPAFVEENPTRREGNHSRRAQRISPGLNRPGCSFAQRWRASCIIFRERFAPSRCSPLRCSSPGLNRLGCSLAIDCHHACEVSTESWSDGIVEDSPARIVRSVPSSSRIVSAPITTYPLCDSWRNFVPATAHNRLRQPALRRLLTQNGLWRPPAMPAAPMRSTSGCSGRVRQSCRLFSPTSRPNWQRNDRRTPGPAPFSTGIYTLSTKAALIKWHAHCQCCVAQLRAMTDCRPPVRIGSGRSP
jgi:hypothetical protein